MFKHPSYYKKLRERNKSDRVISERQATASSMRAPGLGQSLTRDSNADGGEGSSSKQQASSLKLQAPSASSHKPQASSPKHKGSSFKPQASSALIPEPGNK